MTGTGGSAEDPYDEVPHPGFPYPETHPDRLATIATLFGLQPAPPDRCRVLELGCGDGGNLIPMAWALPESRFVGVELSSRAVAAAAAEIAALGLANIEIHRMDLREIGPSFGAFDYVIAHGLFSWVPADAREKIFQLARAHLTRHGVAYLSYDTYPGGRLREAAREMMLYHARRATDPAGKIRRARELLTALRDASSPPDPYRVFLAAEIERLQARSDACLYHAELGDVYQPVYFHEFIAQAQRHGLQYLGEANFFDMAHAPLPAPAAALLADSADDLLVAEQYSDFLRCRCFRRTLLCHREAPVDRAIPPERVRKLYAASAFAPVEDAHPQPGAAVEFRGPQGRKAVTAHPLAIAALTEPARRWPACLAFSDLLDKVQPRLEPGRPAPAALADFLLRACAAGVVELHVWAAPVARKAGERPTAGALARRQALSRSEVTTFRHTTVRVEGDNEMRLSSADQATHHRARGRRTRTTAARLAGRHARSRRPAARSGPARLRPRTTGGEPGPPRSPRSPRVLESAKTSRRPADA